MSDAPRTRPSRQLRPWLLVGLALLLVAALPHSAVSTVHARPSQPRRIAASPPNIVLILTDDQRWDTLGPQYMPNVQSELMDHGITFSNAFVVELAVLPQPREHPHGRVLALHRRLLEHRAVRRIPLLRRPTTTPSPRGCRRRVPHGAHRQVPERLQRDRYIPPGWDRWVAFYDAPAGGAYYDYTLDVDGTLVAYGTTPTPTTRPTCWPARRLVHPPTHPASRCSCTSRRRRRTAPRRPPRSTRTRFNGPGALAAAELQRGRRLATSPRGCRTCRSSPPRRRARSIERRKNQYRTLLSVDDAVDTIVTALTDTGRLSNTLIVFMSDNGWSAGGAPLEQQGGAVRGEHPGPDDRSVRPADHLSQHEPGHGD